MTGDYAIDSGFPVLLEHHLQMLQASGISQECIQAREYTSAITKIELRKLGFNELQSTCVPALILPTYRPCGERGIVQMRPDRPRQFPDGRVAKYEMPSKERLCLDVPPLVRKDIGDPSTPLFITEGIKKGDSLASRGACTVGLLGVTAWRGTNDKGGKVALPDWAEIALNDREVFVVFDSDIMRKKAVYFALRSLRDWLQSRGAKPFLIYLPNREGGTKIGVDDYLAQGHSLDDLLKLVTETLLPYPEEEGEAQSETPYCETPQGLVWRKPSGEGVTEIPLTNFLAHIKEQITADDGVESELEYLIEAKRGNIVRQFCVPFASFPSLKWASEHLGAATVVYPGMSLKEHAETAIRLLSGEPIERRIYTHTGWRRFESGEWGYLHAGGVIGCDGAEARLSGVLERYRLPEAPEGEALRIAFRAFLDLCGLTRYEIILPLIAAVFRSAMSGTDFTLSLTGPSGAFKSELASLAQRFFGAEMDANHLPASWSSTENSLEDLAFRVKDALLVVDDFAPVGSEAQRLHTKADRVIRAQGNQSGRQRMRRDLTLTAPRPPRGLILSTGEDVPQGKSCKARQFILEVEPGDIFPEKLTPCQKNASAGRYAELMSAFLSWLAPHYEEVQKSIPQEVARLRERVSLEGVHRRTPETVAELMVGIQTLLRFIEAKGFLSKDNREQFQKEAWDALLLASASQAVHLRASDPATRFLELLRSALSSGQCFVANPQGGRPPQSERWGWRFRNTGNEHLNGEWLPQGRCIGWVEGENLFLEKDEAFSVAKRAGETGGEGISISPVTLYKRLKEVNLLLSIDQARGTNYVRRVLQEATQKVLHLSVTTLVGEETDKTDISDKGTS